MSHTYAPTLAEVTVVGDTLAVSDAGREIGSRIRGAIGTLRESIVLGMPFQETTDRLLEVSREARNPDWDGYGALPLSRAALQHGRRFLDAAPEWVPIPEIGADPDGELSLDWFGPGASIFSVSISDDATITYAGIYGVSRTHGVEIFGEDWPESLVQGLKRLIG